MDIFEGFAKGTVEGFLSGAGSLAKAIREAITGKAILDPNKQAEILAQVTVLEASAKARQDELEKQIVTGAQEVAKIEASSSDPYARRWRPTVGWICSLGLGYEMLLRPILPWIVQVGAIIAGRNPSSVPLMPEIPLEDLIIILFPLLGFGAYRMNEKIKGVTK